MYVQSCRNYATNYAAGVRGAIDTREQLPGMALRKNNDFRVAAEDRDGALREDPSGDFRVAQ